MFHFLEGHKPLKGYDYQFVDTVPERFICSICTLPMRRPRLVLCCEQKYCHSCLKKRLKKNPSCPHCGHGSAESGLGFRLQHVSEKGLAREIHSLHIKCSNYDKGCQWRGQLTKISHHLNNSFGSKEFSVGCDFVKISCDHCLQWKGERRHYQAHLTSEDGCPDYSVQCPFLCQGGKNYMSRKNIFKHLQGRCENRNFKCIRCFQYKYGGDSAHGLECPKFPVDCANICSKKGLLQGGIKDHLLVCKYEVASCDYSHLGCEKKVRYQDMPQHLANSSGSHLKMMTKTYEELSQELVEVKAEMADRANVARMESQLADDKFSNRPIQLQDGLASLKSLFGDRKCSGDKKLDFRILSYQEIKRFKEEWQSPMFQLLEHDFYLMLKAHKLPNKLNLELWNTVPAKAATSASNLKVFIEVKKPSHRKLQMFAQAKPFPFPTPEKFKKESTLGTVSSQLQGLSLNSRTKVTTSSKRKKSGFMMSAKPSTNGQGKPMLVNWNNPILKQPSVKLTSTVASIAETGTITALLQVSSLFGKKSLPMSTEQVSSFGLLGKLGTATISSVPSEKPKVTLTPSLSESITSPVSTQSSLKQSSAVFSGLSPVKPELCGLFSTSDTMKFTAGIESSNKYPLGIPVTEKTSSFSSSVYTFDAQSDSPSAPCLDSAIIMSSRSSSCHSLQHDREEGFVCSWDVETSEKWENDYVEENSLQLTVCT